MPWDYLMSTLMSILQVYLGYTCGAYLRYTSPRDTLGILTEYT